MTDERARPTHKLTDQRAEQVVDFIREFHRVHQYPPSRREIAASVGLVSSAAGQELIAELERRGLIEVDRRIPRGIRLTVGKALTEEV